MRIFSREAAEIVPHPADDPCNLGLGKAGKGTAMDSVFDSAAWPASSHYVDRSSLYLIDMVGFSIRAPAHPQGSRNALSRVANSRCRFIEEFDWMRKFGM